MKQSRALMQSNIQHHLSLEIWRMKILKVARNLPHSGEFLSYTPSILVYIKPAVQGTLSILNSILKHG